MWDGARCGWSHLVSCNTSTVAGNSTRLLTEPSTVECPEYLQDTFLSWREAAMPATPDFLAADSAAECQKLCLARAECESWNFNPTWGCNLKTAVVGRREMAGWVSGSRAACHPAPCTTTAGQPCKFPFLYRGQEWSHCTTVDSVNGAAWCAVEVGGDGEVVPGRWGDCRLPGCPVLAAPPCTTVTNASCVFPFRYRGRSYHACTRDYSSNGQPWCAVRVDGAGRVVEGGWADCRGGCPLQGGGAAPLQCGAQCGSLQPLTNTVGYTCFCDTACPELGDCCTGYREQCGAPAPGPGPGLPPALASLATGLLASWPAVGAVVRAVTELGSCGPQEDKWVWRPQPRLPGQACGLPPPTFPSVDYLLSVYRQFQVRKYRNNRDC